MDVDGLIAAAERRTGVEAATSPTYRHGLAQVVAALAAHPSRTPAGREFIGSEIARSLDNRLRIDDYIARHPEVLDEAVAAPVVICGMPRTGTTAVSYLFDRDPQWRSLLHWEVHHPIPPARTATLRTDTRCFERQAYLDQIEDALTELPPHWERADGPTECTFVHAREFASADLEAFLADDGYREFLTQGDMGPAYDHQRRTLQVAQSQAPGRWVLKMPAHALHISWLLDAFPDCRIIQTHRDPVRAVASTLATVSFAHLVGVGEIDVAYLARAYPALSAAHATRPDDRRPQMAPDRMIDVYHADLFADPVGEMRRVYEWLGLDLGDTAATAMAGWMGEDRERQATRPGYRLEDYGLSAADVTAHFEAYLDRHPKLTNPDVRST